VIRFGVADLVAVAAEVPRRSPPRSSSRSTAGSSLAVDLDEVRRIVGDGRGAPPRRIPLTPRALTALDLARREAAAHGRTAVATEHILVGLVREGGGIAARVLLGRGTTPDDLRRRVLGRAAEDGPASSAASPVGGAGSRGGAGCGPAGGTGPEPAPSSTIRKSESVC
jgi:hypothetical protein